MADKGKGTEVMKPFDADAEIIEPAPFDGSQRLPFHQWAPLIDWAVTTEHECYGHEAPPEGVPIRWAIYDAGEDDPPLAVCDDEEIALEIVGCLKAYVEMVARNG